MRLVPLYYKGFQINVEKNKSHTTPDREKPELTEREELETMGCMLSSQKGDKIFFVVVTYVWLVAIEYILCTLYVHRCADDHKSSYIYMGLCPRATTRYIDLKMEFPI